MIVADLQQHLVHMGSWLAAAGVKGNPQPDLKAVVEGLTPFREYKLSDFAAFLTRAETFVRTGQLPVKGGGRSSSPRRPKTPAPDAAQLSQEALSLYQRAADSAVTKEHIDAFLSRLGKLTKDGLLEIAQPLDIKLPKSATKSKILDEIQKRIVDRKRIYQRAGLINPNEEASPKPLDHPMKALES
ncbi:MAG: hypothetical protein ACJ8FY_01055 [Gemmataceae bacterium]